VAYYNVMFWAFVWINWEKPEKFSVQPFSDQDMNPGTPEDEAGFANQSIATFSTFTTGAKNVFSFACRVLLPGNTRMYCACVVLFLCQFENKQK